MILLPIPIEVWMEILDFMRGHRRQLAAKCNQLGDRTFVSDICQHWLHKYTLNVQMRSLLIKPGKIYDKDGMVKTNGLLDVYDSSTRGPVPFPFVQVQMAEHIREIRIQKCQVRVPFARVPMPENITAFSQIEIRYFDANVLNFLRMMQSLFTANHNVHFEFANNGDGGLEMAGVALGHVLPLLGGIETVCFVGPYTRFLPTIFDQFSTQATAPKLIEHYMCAGHGQFMPQILRWLHTNQADAQPRMALLFYGVEFPDTVWRPFYDAIREQFLAATTPVNLFVFFSDTYFALNPTGELNASHQELNAENRVTGEQLIVRTRQRGNAVVMLFGRCPAKVDGDNWLREVEQKAKEMREQPKMNVLLNCAQLGSMEAAAGGDNDANDDDGADDDQPGPSKKRRLK